MTFRSAAPRRSAPAPRGSASACTGSRASTITSSSAACTDEAANRRWCETSMMLPPRVADLAGDVGQHAGPVGNLQMQPQQPSVAQQIAQQHVGQDARVDVAAGDRRRRRACRGSARGRSAAPRRRPRRRPRPPVLAPSTSRPIASSTVCSGTTSTSITEVADDVERHLADVAHRDALGDRRRRRPTRSRPASRCAMAE